MFRESHLKVSERTVVHEGDVVETLRQIFKEGPKNTRICVEITTGLQCVIVEVLSVPLCPSYFNIRYPSAITDLKISGVFQPILSIY
jgi:hypothetical protein